MTADDGLEGAGSGTANEYEHPGANYPDREDTDGIEPQRAEVRSSNDAEPVVPAPDGAETTQDSPVLEQHETTTQAKIDGILDQTRADLGTVPVDRYEEVLNQRFSDSGIEVPADRVHAFAERLATGQEHT